MRKRISIIIITVFVLALFAGGTFAAETVRASVDSNGNEGNGEAKTPLISADGRYVAFMSHSTNLVPGGTNGTWQIFVHDMLTGTNALVSVDNYGNQANDRCTALSMSSDGRYVAFQSLASNLVPGDTNWVEDVFVHDRVAGTTVRVSVDSYGSEVANGGFTPAISDDGMYVVFVSNSPDLVPGDTNGVKDVFVHDRQTGITERVSVDSYGNQANGESIYPDISADGRYVAFYSRATNLYPDDSNGYDEIFVHDRQTGITELIGSVGYLWDFQSNHEPKLSADGRYVVFSSNDANLVPGDNNSKRDIFVKDRQTGEIILISVDNDGVQANDQCMNPAISMDGRKVSFWSPATNLVADDINGYRDTFVHDRDADENGIYDEAGGIVTELVSVDSDGNQADGVSHGKSSISADGRYVAFDSFATNLVIGDTNGDTDVFVRDTYDQDNDGFNRPEDCDDYDYTIYPGAPEIKHDEIDQDCNGYDLTIDITRANYTAPKNGNPDSLDVWAESSLDSGADLYLEGFGPMNWTGHRWELYIEPTGGDPGTVTVTGIEGSESAQTR